MADRFYLPDLAQGGEVELSGSEAHHLLHVMRAGVGDRVELFDGIGHAVAAEIVSARKKSATLKIVERLDDDTTSDSRLTLACAVPKGDRFGWLVEKATELGVDRLIPLETERSVVHPGDGKLDKMRQTVIAACKQSGRNWLMAIDERMTWSEFVERELRDATALVAHPTGEPLGRVLANLPHNERVVAAIGPEGGFTDVEIELATRAGARIFSLGTSILRTETAAIAIAVYVNQVERVS